MMSYDDWFRSKQGEAYDSMYIFARDAWFAAIEQCKERMGTTADSSQAKAGSQEAITAAVSAALTQEGITSSRTYVMALVQAKIALESSLTVATALKGMVRHDASKITFARGFEKQMEDALAKINSTLDNV